MTYKNRNVVQSRLDISVAACTFESGRNRVGPRRLRISRWHGVLHIITYIVSSKTRSLCCAVTYHINYGRIVLSCVSRGPLYIFQGGRVAAESYGLVPGTQ